MQKAGGIVSIVAGVFAVVASIATFFVGDSLLAIGSFDEVETFGWRGIAISFVIIALGALALNARKKAVGILLMLIAFSGMLFGGPLVAIFMVLAFIGGVLATIGTGRKADPT